MTGAERMRSVRRPALWWLFGVLLATACSSGDEPASDEPASGPTTERRSTTTPPLTAAAVTTAAPTSAAATTAPADEAPESTESPSADVVTPPFAPALGDVVPAVAGFSLVDPDDEVPWHLYRLPDGVVAYHAGIAVAGEDVGRLLVVRDQATGGSAFDRYVEILFDGSGAQFKRSSVQTDQGTVVASNGAPSQWIELEGAAVLRADDPDGAPVTQWAWRDQDLLWMVRGALGSVEPFVRGVLQAQAPALDPYDMQGMTGDLYDHLPDVEGYTYFDATRADTLGQEPPVPVCVERSYFGYIRTDGDNAAFRDGDLLVNVIAGGSGCVDKEYVADVQGRALALPGAGEDTIAGHAVIRSDAFIQFAVGDTILQLRSNDPATFERMAPFIEAFVAGQPSG